MSIGDWTAFANDSGKGASSGSSRNKTWKPIKRFFNHWYNLFISQMIKRKGAEMTRQIVEKTLRMV